MRTARIFFALPALLVTALGCGPMLGSDPPATEDGSLAELVTGAKELRVSWGDTLTVSFHDAVPGQPPCKVFHAKATFNGMPMAADDGGDVAVDDQSFDFDSRYVCGLPSYSIERVSTTKLPAIVHIADESAEIDITVPTPFDAPTLSFEGASGATLVVGEKARLSISEPAFTYELDLSADAGQGFHLPDDALERTSTGIAFTVPSASSGPGILSLSGDWASRCVAHVGEKSTSCDVTTYDSTGLYGVTGKVPVPVTISQ
jgi:hypothetical protein